MAILHRFLVKQNLKIKIEIEHQSTEIFISRWNEKVLDILSRSLLKGKKFDFIEQNS